MKTKNQSNSKERAYEKKENHRMDKRLQYQ